MNKIKRELIKEEKETVKLEKELIIDSSLKNKSFWLGLLSLILGLLFLQFPTLAAETIVLLVLSILFFLIVIITYLWGILLKDNIKKDVEDIKALKKKSRK